MNNFEFHSPLINAIYEASPEGILVVDKNDNIVSHNQKFIEIWRIPNELLTGEEPNTAVGLKDAPILSTVLKSVKHSEYFVARVKELNKNPNLIDYCEIELLDGRTVERHSTVDLDTEAQSPLGADLAQAPELHGAGRERRADDPGSCRAPAHG